MKEVEINWWRSLDKKDIMFKTTRLFGDHMASNYEEDKEKVGIEKHGK